LLNSDTIVKNGCIENCLNYIKEDEKIGALGCKVILKNGQLDHTCKRGFPTPLASLYYFLKLHKICPNNRKFGRYTMSYLSQNNINEVDALVGAFMLIPKKVIEKVGLLDEQFFMYGEDLDWCYRIKKAGWKIVYYPKSEIIHLKGVSSKKKKAKTIYEFHRAMILFFNKHYKNKYNFTVRILVYLGVWSKMCLTYTQNYLKKS
jgi:GT2 family glycosyltransferase